MDYSSDWFSHAFADLDFIQNVKEEDLVAMSTQHLLFDRPSESSRFAPPVSNEELAQRKIDRIPLKTRQQNVWATNVYQEWATNRNKLPETILDIRAPVPLRDELGTCDLSNMDYWFSRFIIEARRKDGTPYPPNTLVGISTGIQRYLREDCGRLEVHLLKEEDPSFFNFRAQLDQRMKELTKQGIGIHRNRADPITTEDEEQLWDSGTLNMDTAQGLSYAVFFYNCKLFGFRGGDEHRNLEVNQYEVITDQDGNQKLVFYGRSAKNLQGGLKQRKIEAKAIEQHGDPSNPRCVVKLFEKYLSSVPKEGPFYRRTGGDGSPDFLESVIGKNPLGSYMKQMFTKAGICMKNRNIRNHSGKVTLCTNLYKENYDDQAICARSGHRSNAVRDYKRPSAQLLKEVSNSLQAPNPNKPKSSKQIPTPLKQETTPVVDAKPSHSDFAPIPEGFLLINIPEGVKGVILQHKGRTALKMELGD